MNAELLEQTRLDVAEKSRSNIFNWRGQFTPQFIEYLLDVFASPSSLIVDPFCGSGTVLLEAAAKQMPALGFEINPAAYAMSKFIGLGNLQINQRAQLFQGVQDKVFRLAKTYHNVPLFEMSDDFRKKYKNLLDCAAALFAAMKGKRELLLALIVLMRAESNGRGDLACALHKACMSVREDLYNLPFSDKKINVELCDARTTHEKCRASADLIITSPPYINVFNYHQNFRALLEVIGFDVLKVAESEIGANRKNRGNRFRTVVQYALDMEQCLASFGMTLKDGGTLVLVVGHESNVRGVPFSNSGILREIADSLGCFHLKGERHRVFVNRFGKPIKEDILILNFTGNVPVQGAAYQIAESYLKDALHRADGEPRDNIIAALSDLPTISASPIFSRKGVI
jgi:DNA modification methylase